jgi:hypothetical protein
MFQAFNVLLCECQTAAESLAEIQPTGKVSHLPFAKPEQLCGLGGGVEWG